MLGSYIKQVLFPLLTKLLENISPADVGGMEETRMRASTLLSKVQEGSCFLSPSVARSEQWLRALVYQGAWVGWGLQKATFSRHICL